MIFTDIIKSLFLILCFQCNITVLAQDSIRHNPDSLLGDSPVAFFAISVADIDNIINWYRDSLGFSVYSRSENLERAMKFALLKYENALIEVLEASDARPKSVIDPSITDSYQVHGFFKAGFVVNNIDSAYKKMQSLGLKIPYKIVRPANGAYRTFGLFDPEGNLLQFFGK